MGCVYAYKDKVGLVKDKTVLIFTNIVSISSAVCDVGVCVFMHDVLFSQRIYSKNGILVVCNTHIYKEEVYNKFQFC